MPGSTLLWLQAARPFRGPHVALFALLLGVPGLARAAESAPSPPEVSALELSEALGPFTEASVGAATLKVRPAHAPPGSLVEIEVRGGTKNSKVRFGGAEVPLFRAGPGLLRGYAGIAVDRQPGELDVELETVSGGKRVRGKVALVVDERSFTRHALRVNSRFTSPSPKQRERSKADGAAFRQAARQPFGPPMFTSNFLSPRAGARINSLFGAQRTFNGKLKSRHMGIDLDGKTGDPIVAANDGVVRMVRDCFSAGNSVVIAHGAGLFTHYYHLARFDVKPGQQVKKGQQIGLMGATGRVTGPHLHLSTKVNATTFDPEALFAFDFFPDEQPPIVAGDTEIAEPGPAAATVN